MNRSVIITGSTRGIGLSTAVEFLKKGDRVTIFCRHPGHVSKAKRYLLAFGRPENILGLVGDVRKETDVRKILKQTQSHYGRIDILVNNAGIAAYKAIEKTSAKEWDDIVDTNLKGTFLFTREVVSMMKKRRKGIIINVSSILGVDGEAMFSAYCASKFGVIGLTQAMADETANAGIRIYAVLPGAVDTQLVSDSGLEMDPSELLRPEEVARKIVELAEGRERSGSLAQIQA
jgi:3-oxoacyl-[acyl-carrier protein] reductase